MNSRFWQNSWHGQQWGRWLSIVLIIVLGVTSCGTSETVRVSNYERLNSSATVTHIIAQPPDQYQPVAAWTGRLILPRTKEVSTRAGDWVWLEVLHTPSFAQELIGQTVVLTWQSDPELDAYVELVSRDVSFSADAYASQQQGNVHPDRFDGWSQVGPLQSLAGARPHDDVLVSLAGVTRQGNTLTINQEPIQIPERFYGLVNIESPAATNNTCDCQAFNVHHYNPDSQQFDGVADVVYLPKMPAINGIRQFSLDQLEQSPAGEHGWYVYGSPNHQEQFIVRAVAPRSLFELQADTTITDSDDELNYINFGNWRRTRDRKGTIKTIQLGQTTWNEGDQGLVLHIFGGIGGEQAEQAGVVGTVTGHFSYGIATVIRDAISQELQFDINYHQVYAHNPNGIVSGKLSWAEYMGNLQRGWLGTRPVSDAIIKLDALTQDYDQVGIKPLAMLEEQLQIMTARYRVGDGTGAAVVTPAQSCIQDSSQALYKTIKRIEAQVRKQPPIDPQQLQPLATLGEHLENALVPVGIVRPDWQQNSEVLAGIHEQSLDNETNLTTQLLSWRTIIPRVAYDQLATIFWEQGATLRFLRTNQVGGSDSTILPLAPTELFGQYFFIPTAFSRLIEAGRIPSMDDWLMTLGVAVAYGAIAIPLGLWGKLLSLHSILGSVRPGQLLIRVLQALLVPAMLEELIFRVLLLPHPTEGVLTTTFMLWTTLSLALFVISHPLQAMIFRPHLMSLFSRPLFIGLTALLGLGCIIIYTNTGSLLTLVGFHWLVVVSWLVFLGGWQRLRFRP